MSEDNVDMEIAKANAVYIKDLSEACLRVHIVIDAFREAAGPYAKPYISAILEAILGVKKEAEE